ncbi:MAG: hypothetical protein H6644_01385 [Caldilineaceae bacterium]|nr:hypothetical protein [Caldilineaceae bacterium]
MLWTGPDRFVPDATSRGRRTLPLVVIVPALLILMVWPRGALAAPAHGPLLQPVDPPQSGPLFTVNSADDPVEGDSVCSELHCTLREAIAASGSVAGATIQFAPTLAGATITLTNPLDIYWDLVIEGPATSRITVSGDDAYTIFYIYADWYAEVSPDVTMRNLNLVSGRDDGESGGGAVNIDVATVTLESVQIADSDAGFSGGGAIKLWSGELTVRDSALVNNRTDGDGGAINNQYGTVNLVNTTLSGNRADGWGGALAGYEFVTEGGLESSPFNLDFVTITANRADADNDATGSGGAFYKIGAGAVTNSIIAGNRAGAVDDDCGTDASTTWSRNLVGVGCSATGTGVLQLGAGALTGMTVADVLAPSPAANGGATVTHALIAGSPALDAAQCGDVASDQRDEPRP